MTEQSDFRMPVAGEIWRHYKGASYTVVGMAVDADGDAIVVYCPAFWTLVQLPALFVQPLGRFVQQVEHDKPRFAFDGPVGSDATCPYLRQSRL